MKIKIVTDSTSDIPQQEMGRLGISAIPLYVNLNGKSYLDTKDLSRRKFYEDLPNSHPHPTTSAPAPGQFIEIYDKLADQGAEAIFSIHISKTLSAILSSAEVAAQQYSRIPVYVIDSGNLSMALGLIVLQAAETALNTGDPDQVQKAIEDTIPRTFAFAKLDTIDYLLKGGRITNIQHSIIGLLGIKPILKMNNHISKMEIVRTKAKGFERVLRVAIENIPHAEKFGITHANAMDQVEKLVLQLKKVFPGMTEPIICEANPALGTHVGPGTLCISWISKPGSSSIEGAKRWHF